MDRAMIKEFIARRVAKELKDGGVLADLIPTMLDVMDMEKPEEMTGKSLIVK